MTTNLIQHQQKLWPPFTNFYDAILSFFYYSMPFLVPTNGELPNIFTYLGIIAERNGLVCEFESESDCALGGDGKLGVARTERKKELGWRGIVCCHPLQRYPNQQYGNFVWQRNSLFFPLNGWLAKIQKRRNIGATKATNSRFGSFDSVRGLVRLSGTGEIKSFLQVEKIYAL